ncbi:hypothetical protein QUW15_08860, partial [Desulfovibrio piger]|nr:hypothetical protein [Desulfovibrio piger]
QCEKWKLSGSRAFQTENALEIKRALRTCRYAAPFSVHTGNGGAERFAAQRRPAQSERKNRVFSAKRQAVWFETQRVATVA